ncbi:MAG TPA: hypothetical protein VEQ37_13355 [Actinomycetota bacterium]|nr:hypothetical protein [Actinomycetota bacterium]
MAGSTPSSPSALRRLLTKNGFAAIKYTSIVIIVLAILAFLAWVLVRFLG